MKRHDNGVVTDGDYCHPHCHHLEKTNDRMPWCALYKWDMEDNHVGAFRCHECFQLHYDPDSNYDPTPYYPDGTDL